LQGISPVYAHTGVITNLSATPTTWKYVQGNWGTPDPSVLMQDLGNDLHKISYPIRSFYGVPAGEEILKMAFVFRNADGSVVGREADGSDIYTDVYPAGQLFAKFVTPSSVNLFVNPGDTIHIWAAASQAATLTLTENGNQLAQATGDSLGYALVAGLTGKNEIVLTADDGSSVVTDTFYYIINPTVQYIDPPAGTQNGINYLNDSTVLLRLYAPGKNNVYILGDFNNWQPDTAYFMRLSQDGTTWWREITGLTPGQEYAYQYLVDEQLKIADPLCEKILDPWNDKYISPSTYPNLKPYPDGKTSGIVSILQTAQTPYTWHDTAYQRPDKRNLVIYELLLRDFLANHDFKTLIDTLDYLQDLGINAIELMPVNEFEGNSSWGYNPSFYLAPDKYYGPAETMKAFIDSSHQRGIAVIMDIALNHACGQCPLVRLYWDAVNSRPAPNSPWFNTVATHPFSICYDFNHESQATRDFVDRVLSHWVINYHVDGYRFDLSKGFTQTNTGNDVNAWAQYDASRIQNLKRIADTLWGIDPGIYVILEHFAVNQEETELANYGMLLWGNMNHDYNEATMGYNSNLSWAAYTTRGWSQPNLVTYMESHDEERLMFKNLQYGNSSGNYNVKNLSTALDRMGLAGAFFFTIPGPKMIYQFGELGYDISIDNPCRTCKKPIKWWYYDEPERQLLYKTWRALIHLKTQYPAFRSTNFSMVTASYNKRIQIYDPSMNVTVVGNFGVTSNSVDPNFPHAGWWYSYLGGDSVNITDPNAWLNLNPGQYYIFTDKRLPKPDLEVPVGTSPISIYTSDEVSVYPQPAGNEVQFSFRVDKPEEAMVNIYSLDGRMIDAFPTNVTPPFARIRWVPPAEAKPGAYLFRITRENRVHTGKFLLVNP